MSRFAIFLCTVLFAYAAYASEWSVAVSVVESAAQARINAAVLKVQMQEIATKKQNFRIVKTISRTVTDSSLQTADEIYLITHKIDSEISKLADKPKGVNISDCFQYHHHLNVTAKRVLRNTSVCYTAKIRMALDQIASINRLIKDEFANLNAMKKETQHCSDNISDTESLAAALLCIKAADKKASSIITRFVEEFTIKNTALKCLSKRFNSLLADCRITTGLTAFHQESSTVVERTNMCIQQKIV